MSKTCAECGTSMGGFLGAPVSGIDPTRCQDCHWKSVQRNDLDPKIVAEQDRVAELRRNADELAKSVAISTTAEIFGREIIDHVGIARGGTVRAKNAISDIGAGIKNMVGGELKAYTQLLADAREQAIHRMRIDAGPHQLSLIGHGNRHDSIPKIYRNRGCRIFMGKEKIKGTIT